MKYPNNLRDRLVIAIPLGNISTRSHPFYASVSRCNQTSFDLPSHNSQRSQAVTRLVNEVTSPYLE